MIPQNVTLRYATNLLLRGTNHDFTLVNAFRENTSVDGIQIGVYYKVLIKRNAPDNDPDSSTTQVAVGLTPVHACQRALSRFGVVFR